MDDAGRRYFDARDKVLDDLFRLCQEHGRLPCVSCAIGVRAEIEAREDEWAAHELDRANITTKASDLLDRASAFRLVAMATRLSHAGAH